MLGCATETHPIFCFAYMLTQIDASVVCTPYRQLLGNVFGNCLHSRWLASTRCTSCDIYLRSLHSVWLIPPVFALNMTCTPYGLHLLYLHSVWFAPNIMCLHCVWFTYYGRESDNVGWSARNHIQPLTQFHRFSAEDMCPP